MMAAGSNNPEEAARKLRKRLGIDGQQWIDPMTVLRKLVEIIPGFTFALVDAPLLEGKQARWDSTRKQIEIRKDVFYAANEGRQEGRARYSIFHEVVHALSGHAGQFYRDVSRDNIPKYARRLREVEAETDRVTAALIAPKHLIQLTDSVDDIAFKFGLSRQAASIRFDEVRGIRRFPRK